MLMDKSVIMKKGNGWKATYGAFLCALILTGCSGGRAKEEIWSENGGTQAVEGQSEETDDAAAGTETEGQSVEITGAEKTGAEESDADMETEPTVVMADWSGYFDGLNGEAVVYDAADGLYRMYPDEAAMIRRSPCSTFKIISSLIALENGIIMPEDSTRTWSGEIFWNEDWNKDIDFREAFAASCVWYYRQVADEIGPDRMQRELDRLQYGNRDISDWEGRLNTNNNNRALTGFWLESSLLISPREQVEVMERIFGENTAYSETTRSELKRVMLVAEQERTDISVYGKTGMGKAAGNVVDAWFTGFAEGAAGNLYFCVHLDRTDGRDVSSRLAKEIAVQIVSDCYGR